MTAADRALLHPAALLSLVLLGLNDHVLKHAAWFPSVLAGKLSDVAGLFVAPRAVTARSLCARLRRSGSCPLAHADTRIHGGFADRSWHAGCCLVCLMRIVGFFACLFAVTSVPFASTAHACGGSSCALEMFLPFEGSLPANAPGVLWKPGHALDATGDTEADQLEWTCASADEAPRPIAFHAESPDPTRTFERLLVADEPLVVGDRCEIAPSFESCGVGYDSEGDLPYLSSRASFMITEAAPLPTALGMLRAQLAAIAPVRLSTTRGSCSIATEVCGSRIELELSDEAAPWADVLRYETRVDGEGWYAASSLVVPNVTGGSHKGRGLDLIFVAHDETESAGLDHERAYSVTMRATVPGASSSTETPVVTIDLTCESIDPLRDAGSPDPVEEPTPADSGPAPTGEDATTPADDNSVPAADPAGPPIDRQSNCGCSIPGHGSSNRVGSIMLALVMLYGARRIRREP